MTLPSDLAADLEDASLAAPIRDSRGSEFGEAVTFVIDAINTGSAAVNVAVGVAACRRLAQSVKARRGSSRTAKLQIEVGGKKHAVKVDLDEPGAEDKLFDYFVKALEVGAP